MVKIVYASRPIQRIPMRLIGCSIARSTTQRRDRPITARMTNA
jgi:hypothetical protein